MLKTQVALLAATALMAGCVDAQNSAQNAAKPSAQAQAAVEANIKKVIEPRLGDGVKVDSVRKTPYAGLYEIRAAGDILYTDEKGDYIIVGNIFNAQTSENLTKARLDEINKISWSDLPLQHALKMVKGDGKRVMAIFEDPNCGYCKRFRATTLQQLDNVTVYTFMLNILSEDSITKSRNIWCAPDRNKAWDEWMLEGKLPAAAPAECKAPHEEVAALGRKYRISGTPAIFFADGTRIPGAVDLKTIESKFASIK